jgi:hypothetical protein
MMKKDGRCLVVNPGLRLRRSLILGYHLSPLNRALAGIMQLEMGSARVSRAAGGVSPQARTHHSTIAGQCSWFLGEHARLGRCSVRLAPNLSGMAFPSVRVSREGAAHCARGGRAPLSNGIVPA